VTRRQDIIDIESAFAEHGEYSYEDSMNIEYYEGMIDAYNDVLALFDSQTIRYQKILKELMDYYQADADISTDETDAEYYIGQVEAVEKIGLALGLISAEGSENNQIVRLNRPQDEDPNTGS